MVKYTLISSLLRDSGNNCFSVAIVTHVKVTFFEHPLKKNTRVDILGTNLAAVVLK